MALPRNGYVQPVEGISGGIAHNVIITGVVPGTVIAAQADTAVPALTIVPLPVAPAGTRRMTVQNTGPAGSLVRIRQVGGAAGSGIKIGSLGSTSFGGADGAIAALEAEDVSGGAGVATTIGVTFEEN